MPKVKTNSAAKKRFKKLGNGKIKRAKAYKRHLLTKKAERPSAIYAERLM